MCDKIVKMGVIGVGLQGEGHVKCFQAMHNARVVAVADIDEAKAKDKAAKYGVPLHFTDYRQMLRDTDLDGVSVVTPDHLHLEPALAVLAARKHMLIEKPLATTVADGEAIAAAARKAGVKAMINLSNRFQTSLQDTKTRFERGELGKPVYAYTRLNNTLYVPLQMLKPWSRHTKLPFWLLSHTIDRVRWLWGSDAKRVYAVAHSGILAAMGVDTPDLYVATVEFENGATGVFETCWILPEKSPMVVDSYMELIYTQSCVKIDAQQTGITVATKDAFTFPATLTGTVMGHPVGFVAESLRHFVECILEDKPPTITMDDGLAVCKISAAIVESAQTRQPVDL
ncbi:MAG: Gfo/Idh/MocA family oxidoreductase [Planctomycetes bacterium]|nr:Gfo/Idh/MocA family oxidoreductase [Planctomycetota bacterium]